MQQFERGGDGGGGVVGVGPGGAEEADRAIPDVLNDHPAMLTDDRDEERAMRIDSRYGLVVAGGLAEGDVAGEVGDQDGDFTKLRRREEFGFGEDLLDKFGVNIVLELVDDREASLPAAVLADEPVRDDGTGCGEDPPRKPHGRPSFPLHPTLSGW